jgi:large subunit ribosomal protein L9
MARIPSRGRDAMKVLLTSNVPKLGQVGEVCDVKPGYGRNYLLPQGLAVELTPDNLNRFETMKRRLIALEQETKDKMIVLSKEIEKASCTIIANSTEEGHLFGSVTARDIAQQLAGDGFQVDQKWIVLDQPIKELGIYMVKVRLHPEVECQMKVWVVKGDDPAEARRKAREGTGAGLEEGSAPETAEGETEAEADADAEP